MNLFVNTTVNNTAYIFKHLDRRKTFNDRISAPKLSHNLVQNPFLESVWTATGPNETGSDTQYLNWLYIENCNITATTKKLHFWFHDSNQYHEVCDRSVHC